MLSTLTEKRFSSADWIFERKLDGERCLIVRNRSRVRLLSRNRKSLNGTYPELADAVGRGALQQYIADGEIVAFERGRTSFSRLQGRIGIRDPDKARATGIKVYLYLFDLLYADGYDLRKLPLRERKEALRQLIEFENPIRYTSHKNEKGESYFREACRKGWEGLIAKKADSPYISSRSRSWLKFKCVRRQELVIGGYTTPQGSRKGFGALLLGYYREKNLHYAGKVGTGFDEDMLASLSKKLRSRSRKSSPFYSSPSIRGAHWVTPNLVAEIGFTEWTKEGRLRHPRFIGLRTDKPARKVVRERSR